MARGCYSLFPFAFTPALDLALVRHGQELGHGSRDKVIEVSEEPAMLAASHYRVPHNPNNKAIL